MDPSRSIGTARVRLAHGPAPGPAPGSVLAALIAPALAGALALWAPAHAAAAPAAPRALLVQVRDTPPSAGASFRRGQDNSYTVSTGGTGASEDARPNPGPDNSTTVSTGNARRVLRLLEGERVRVDLPAVESLQFHVPLGARGAAGRPGSAGTAVLPAASSGGSADASSADGAGASAAGAGPGATGVLTFASVAAFSARFYLQGERVRVELTPLRAGGVAAPLVGGTDAPRPVTVMGTVGAWFALGDPDLASPARQLTPGAAPAGASGVWVRVLPADPASVDPEAQDANDQPGPP